jgi:hypothetical protein
MNRRQLMRSVAVGLPAAALGGIVSQVSTSYAESRTTADDCEPPPCTPGTGRVVQWGDASAPAVPADALSGVTAISAGAAANSYNLTLKNGRVSIWGNLNPDDSIQQRLSRVPVAATRNVTAIAAAGNYGLALRDGGVIAWGGAYDSDAVIRVPDEAKSGVTAIAGGAGPGPVCLALKNGGVINWGGYAPVPDAAKSGVVAISTQQHCLALREDGSVVTWARSGLQPPPPANLMTVPAEARSGVTAISAGTGFSLALKDGGVIAWGDNKYGQLEVPYEAQSDVVAISAGVWASMALTASGTIVVWAFNFYHQLDIPPEAQCGASAISCKYHCLALI